MFPSYVKRLLFQHVVIKTLLGFPGPIFYNQAFLEILVKWSCAISNPDKNWRRYCKIAKGILNRFDEHSESSSPEVRNTQVVKSQAGVVGDYARVNEIKIINEVKPDDNSDEILLLYCQETIRSFQHLSLRGLDKEASDPSGNQQPLALDQVYVALDTDRLIEVADPKTGGTADDPLPVPDKRPLSALEAATQHRCLVILGDPGSGKSTFVNHLALCLLQNRIFHQHCDQLNCWPKADAELIPIHIVLRDFAAWASEPDERADAQVMMDFISYRLERQHLSAAFPVLENALEKGQAIVLIDGLDEIPTNEKRRFTKNAVAEFAQRFGRCRFIVTCRTLSYQNTEWRLDEDDFPSFELAPFDEKKIDTFIQAWFNDLMRLNVIKTTGEVMQEIRRLKEAIRRPDLRRLTPNPLMLTVMALVHTHKGRLPDARALLYEETVDILLWRWEQVKMAGGQSSPRLQTLLLEAGRADVDLKKMLWQLAYDVHGQAGDDTADSLADIQEWDLAKRLAGLHPQGSKDWADAVIETIRMRAGLLLERAPEIYSFPHRTFQEYLAGAFLASQSDFSNKASELIEAGNFWWGVVLLAVGRLIYLSGDVDKPLALVGELCLGSSADDDIAWRKVWLAGEVLVEMGIHRVNDSPLGKDLAGRVKKKLVTLTEAGHLKPKERVAAANALSRLGDPRFNPSNWYLPNDEDFGFVEIPAGPFMMGEGEERHAVELSAYAISKYPVTVAQFEAFAAESGYGLHEEWEKYNPQKNHPAVKVSWEDAQTYCKWLSGKLKELGFTVNLPTEAQWERAARRTDERKYPWGDIDIDPNKANYDETGISNTSPVGCFPEGKNELGLLDMAGNVWEWCLDWYGEYPKQNVRNPVGPPKGANRVLRGGSWIYSAEDCRSAYRSRFRPYYRFNSIGFRLVRLPGQQGEPGQ